MDLHVGLNDTASVSGPDVLARLADRFAGAALEADLNNVAGLLLRCDHGLALADIVGERLFFVDGNATFAGSDKGKRVPVRRGRDDDRVEILHGKQILVFLELFRLGGLLLLDLGRGFRQVRGVEVTDGGDFDAPGLHGGVPIDEPIPAAADDSEPQLGFLGKRGGYGGCGEKGSAGDWLHVAFILKERRGRDRL